METKSFLPDYGSLSVDGAYLPLFKLFAGESWRYVRRKGQKVRCETAAAAIIAAKEHVRAILNPPILTTKAEQNIPEIIPEILDVDAWRQSKAEEQAAERERVFSGTIFRKGRAIQVEKRRARV